MTNIFFLGKPVELNGRLPLEGEIASDFSLVNNKLNEVTLASFGKTIKVLSIVPSLDTPVCATSTRMFNQKVSKWDNVVMLVVSADLPFAQSRFCETDGLSNIVPLSTFRSSFAVDYGVQIANTVLKGLLTRTIFVLDEQNKIVYKEVVREITEEPNYDQITEVVKNLQN